MTRYKREHVYTYCGIVLVAINPYKSCPIYEKDFIDLYRERDNNELDPHIYSIANNAFTDRHYRLIHQYNNSICHHVRTSVWDALN